MYSLRHSLSEVIWICQRKCLLWASTCSASAILKLFILLSRHWPFHYVKLQLTTTDCSQCDLLAFFFPPSFLSFFFFFPGSFLHFLICLSAFWISPYVLLPSLIVFIFCFCFLFNFPYFIPRFLPLHLSFSPFLPLCPPLFFHSSPIFLFLPHLPGSLTTLHSVNYSIGPWCIAATQGIEPVAL